MEMDLFAGVAVSDFGRAVAWFERLFGRPATFEAYDTDWVWTLAEHRSIYVKLRPEDAGHSMVTVFLSDLDSFVESAASRGIDPQTLQTLRTASVRRSTEIPTATSSASGELRGTRRR